MIFKYTTNIIKKWEFNFCVDGAFYVLNFFHCNDYMIINIYVLT